MIDINYIRNNPEKVKEIIKLRKVNPQKADVDRLLSLDRQRNEILSEISTVNQERNKIANILSTKKDETLVERGKVLKKEEQELSKALEIIEKEWFEILSWIPNIPLEGVKIGKDDTENTEIYAWTPSLGELGKDQIGGYMDSAKYMPKTPPHSDKEFQGKHHLDLLEELGLCDFKQGAKVSGARFTYLIGDIVKLQFALQNFILEELYKRGFTPINPPLLVKERVLFGTSHFPEGRDQAYEIKSDYLEEKESLFLVGSSEPPNFAYAMDKILNEDELPLKLVASTVCFRTEVGSWGRDTRGLKRMHQFDKLELDVICTPEQSEKIYDELLDINKWLLKNLELPFHIIEKCTGDMGYSASAKQADVEVWLPGQQTFMEVGTNTNTTDYQARRLNIKYRKKINGEKEYCHTVNDTGIAFGRMIIAIVENYQQKDGSIKIPKALVKYMGKEYITKN